MGDEEEEDDDDDDVDEDVDCRRAARFFAFGAADADGAAGDARSAIGVGGMPRGVAKAEAPLAPCGCTVDNGVLKPASGDMPRCCLNGGGVA